MDSHDRGGYAGTYSEVSGISRETTLAFSRRGSPAYAKTSCPIPGHRTPDVTRVGGGFDGSS